MARQKLSIVLASFLVSTSIFVAFAAVTVYAQSADITYPVAELGNCASKDACRAYCDDLTNASACASFAEAHGLMSEEEADQLRAFGGEGPGGCTTKDSCEAYCENVAHIDECLAFAEANDVMSPEELEDARGVARALAQGAQLPGGCTSKSACEAYCEDMSHMNECIAFAEQAGFMKGEELAEAKRMASFIEAGGTMPGNCQGEAACKSYCEVEEHMTECAEFAIEAGFMSPEEAEMFRKTGGKGPGGCVGRACEAYCHDEAHREECIAFAMEHDLMSPEDKQRMEEGREKAQEALREAPEEVRECVEERIGSEHFARIESGEGMMSPALGEIMPECFQEVMGGEQHSGPFGQGVPPEAAECMRKVFGDDFEAQMRAGTLDPGARDQEIRSCMQERMGEGYLNDEGQWEKPQMDEHRPPPADGQYMMPMGDYMPRSEEPHPYPPNMPPQGLPYEGDGQPPYSQEDMMHWQGMPPSGEGGMMPPQDSLMPSPTDVPFHDGTAPAFEPPHEEGEPVSMNQSLVANVLFVITGLLGF